MRYAIRVGYDYLGKEGQINAPFRDARLFDCYPIAAYMAKVLRAYGLYVEIIQV